MLVFYFEHLVHLLFLLLSLPLPSTLTSLNICVAFLFTLLFCFLLSYFYCFSYYLLTSYVFFHYIFSGYSRDYNKYTFTYCIYYAYYGTSDYFYHSLIMQVPYTLIPPTFLHYYFIFYLYIFYIS